MILEKTIFQLLLEAVTDFNIKTHQKHYYFYIITQNKQITHKITKQPALFLTP